LIFEFLGALASTNSTFVLVISSITIGGEVTFKAFALTLFAFKYFDASLEQPYFKTINGKKKMQLETENNIIIMKGYVDKVRNIFIGLFAANWILITTAYYLFTS